MAAWDLILKDAKGNDTVEERKVLVGELSCVNRKAGGVIDCQVLRKMEVTQGIAGGARNNPVTKVTSRSGGYLNDSVKVESKEILISLEWDYRCSCCLFSDRVLI